MKLIWLFLIPCIAHAKSITVSGNPQTLTVCQATAGSQPNSVTDSSTTYSVQVSKNTIASISGYINSAVPSNTTLSVTLAAPKNATSIPSVSLSTTPQVLVSNIQSGNYKNLTITYQFLATVAAGVVSLSSRTLTLTITAN